MGARGRKSSSALAVVSPFITPPPAAPDDMPAEMQEVWRRTVGGLPAEFFPPETWPLLEQFCRHTIAARRIAQSIRALERSDEFDPDEWREWLRAQQRETASLKAIAASLRISNQARYGARAAATAADRGGGPKPWDPEF